MGAAWRKRLSLPGDGRVEDWLNDVGPSLFFLRAFALRNSIVFNYLTIDTHSVTFFLDHSDPTTPLGNQPRDGGGLALMEPKNKQSSEATIRAFMTAATASLATTK